MNNFKEHDWSQGKFRAVIDEIPGRGTMEEIISICVNCNTFRWGAVSGGRCRK